MINQFEIPPFMLDLSGVRTQYSIPWNVLASIHKIESAFWTNMGPSTAGAVGQMQFLPSTWHAYGVDANRDGRKDVQPARRGVRRGALPEGRRRRGRPRRDLRLQPRRLVRRRGAAGRAPVRAPARRHRRFIHGPHRGRPPVAARATADDLSEREILKRTKLQRAVPARWRHGGDDRVLRDAPRDKHLLPQGAPVVAVNDGEIEDVGRSKGSAATSSSRTRTATASPMPVGEVSKLYPVPKQDKLSPRTSSSSTPRTRSPTSRRAQGHGPARPRGASAKRGRLPVNSEDLRRRLYAYPERPRTSTAPTSPASSTRCSPTASPATRRSRRTSAECSSSTAARWRCARSRRARRSSRGRCWAGSEDLGARPRPLRDRAGGSRITRRSTRSRSSTDGSCSSRRRSTARRAAARSPRRT